MTIKAKSKSYPGRDRIRCSFSQQRILQRKRIKMIHLQRNKRPMRVVLHTIVSQSLLKILLDCRRISTLVTSLI